MCDVGQTQHRKRTDVALEQGDVLEKQVLRELIEVFRHPTLA